MNKDLLALAEENERRRQRGDPPCLISHRLFKQSLWRGKEDEFRESAAHSDVPCVHPAWRPGALLSFLGHAEILIIAGSAEAAG